MVGTGPLRINLRKQSNRIAAPHLISWFGEADARAVIAASSVIVVHSRKEGLPHGLVEAAALSLNRTLLAGLGFDQHDVNDPGTPR